MWMRPENHPDLKAWLASPRLKAAVKSYLPNAYERAGVVALRLGDGVKALAQAGRADAGGPLLRRRRPRDRRDEMCIINSFYSQ